jgi:hypothetical protein
MTGQAAILQTPSVYMPAVKDANGMVFYSARFDVNVSFIMAG